MWELEKSLRLHDKMRLGWLYCEHPSSSKYEQIRDKDLNKEGQRGVMGTHESRKSGQQGVMGTHESQKSGQAGNQNRDAGTT